MSDEQSYEGQELRLFATAHRWKRYWSSKVRPYLGPSVLEVGAGLGANTSFLYGPKQEQWLCLEPDATLSSQIPATLAPQPWRDHVKTRVGTLRDLGTEEIFDSILYIDVLEHIEDDRAELRAAYAHLKPGGKVIVLAPAYPWLFTAFDRGIGHYRRYTKKSLRTCTPEGSSLIELFFLDAIGAGASIANKLFLHQHMPSYRQIQFWDRWLVSSSRWIDPLIGYSAGKSLLGIWQKP